MSRCPKKVLARLTILLAATLLLGCGDAGSDASTAGKSIDGIRFTINGPAFSEPATFVVPGNAPQLRTYLSDSMFSLMLSPNEVFRSTDGKHVLTHMNIGTEPAGVGEFTEEKGVTGVSFSFTTDADTETRQGPSMKFNYSKGERQPVRIVMTTYENVVRAAGHFTAKVQRTNIKSNDQIYDVTGTFDVRN